MNKFKIITLGLFLTTILSCSDNESNEKVNTSTQGREDDYLLKLGTKLENPYSVKNMRRALDSVKAKMTISKTAKSTSEFDIETSHLYVKIEPKNAACVKAKKVKNLDTGEIFENATLAEFHYQGYKSGNLSKACTGKNKTFAGYRWKYV